MNNKDRLKVKEICADCETYFISYVGSKAMLCPSCIRRRLSENAKKRHLNEIGNLARMKNRKEENNEHQSIEAQHQEGYHEA